MDFGRLIGYQLEYTSTECFQGTQSKIYMNMLFAEGYVLFCEPDMLQQPIIEDFVGSSSMRALEPVRASMHTLACNSTMFAQALTACIILC